jgi:hypothetical protein
MKEREKEQKETKATNQRTRSKNKAKRQKYQLIHQPATTPPNPNGSNPAPPSYGEYPTAELLPSSKIAFIA